VLRLEAIRTGECKIHSEQINNNVYLALLTTRHYTSVRPIKLQRLLSRAYLQININQQLLSLRVWSVSRPAGVTAINWSRLSLSFSPYKAPSNGNPFDTRTQYPARRRVTWQWRHHEATNKSVTMRASSSSLDGSTNDWWHATHLSTPVSLYLKVFLSNVTSLLLIYTACPEKRVYSILGITSSNIGRFSKFFHFRNFLKIRDKAVDHTSNASLHYLAK